MPLFKRREPRGGAPAPAIDGQARRAAWEGLRAGNPSAPALTDPVVLASIPIAEAAAGGPLDGLLEGKVFESWQTADAAHPYVACVFEPDGSLSQAVACDRSAGGDYLLVFTPDGDASRQGPFPQPFADARAWTTAIFDVILAVVGRQALRDSGAVIEDTRVRAASNPPFQRFAAAVPSVPLIDSWQVSERIPGTGTTVELWERTVDAQTSPPNPYHTPRVAAQLGADGSISAMVAVETMPDMHGDAFLILFDENGRMNLGARPDLLDGAAFREVALQMLLR